MLYGKTQTEKMSHDFRYRGTTADLSIKAPASTGVQECFKASEESEFTISMEMKYKLCKISSFIQYCPQWLLWGGKAILPEPDRMSDSL